MRLNHAARLPIAELNQLYPRPGVDDRARGCSFNHGPLLSVFEVSGKTEAPGLPCLSHHPQPMGHIATTIFSRRVSHGLREFMIGSRSS